MPPPSLPQRPVDAAVVFASPSSAGVFLDRLTGTRRLQAAGFGSIEGRLGERRVVAATLVGECGVAKVLTALRTAHAPPVIIGAGLSNRVGDALPAGAALLASRVIGPGGASLRMANMPRAAHELTKGVVIGASEVEPTETTAATNPWAFPFATACAEMALPAAVVTVVCNDAAPGIQPPRHLAWRAGRLVRTVWKNPRHVLEVARETSQRWEDQATLAGAIEKVIESID